MRWKCKIRHTSYASFLNLKFVYRNSTTKAKTTCSPGKLAQTELIISDLKKFFAGNTPTTVKGKLSDDVKEVTKIEMRNDLSKKQLLFILIVSLFEDMADPSSANMLVILKARHPLFNTVRYIFLVLHSCVYLHHILLSL